MNVLTYDIAAGAGMSRPALYQYVRNKDDVFRRLADGLFARALAQARAIAAGPGPVADRLHAVLATKLELTLRLARDSPHAAELRPRPARRRLRRGIDLLAAGLTTDPGAAP